MADKQHKPGEIVTKLQQVEVPAGQGMARVDAIRELCITERTYYRLRKQYDGMGTDRLREPKPLGKENDQSHVRVGALIGADIWVV